MPDLPRPGEGAGGFLFRFWYCKKECGWACWRPPVPWPCPECKSPTIWANSRLSFACFRCGHRVRPDATSALSLCRQDWLPAADRLPGRHWHRTPGLPNTPPDTSRDALVRLEHALGTYLRAEQGRGQRVTVEHLVRAGREHYLLCYPDDYTHTHVRHNALGRLDRVPVRPRPGRSHPRRRRAAGRGRRDGGVGPGSPARLDSPEVFAARPMPTRGNLRSL